MLKKTVSVVIPCRNEENYIADCIESILNLDYFSDLLEIIVVDGSSTDNTLSIIKRLQSKYKNIRLLNNPNLFTPYALNIGIKAALHDYIFIAGAHSKFSKNYIIECLNVIKEYKCDGAGGILITDVKNNTSKAVSICKVLSHKYGVGNSMFRIGTEKPISVDIVPFGIYNKNIFSEVGYYNELLIRNQDMEFSKRLLSKKKKIFLTPNAKAIYYARESFLSLAKNNFGNGYWIPLTIYTTKKISSLSLRHFVPMIFVFIALFSFLLGFFQVKFFYMCAALLIAYFSIIGFISMKINYPKTKFKYLFGAFMVLHFSYGIGSLVGIFRLDAILSKRPK